MRRDLISCSRLRSIGGGVLLLALLAGCASPPTVPASSVSPVAAGVSRIWFYRDYEPSVSRNLAPVTLNGVVAGYAQPDGSAFYRDIPPGRYHVTVVSKVLDANQERDVDLPPGQEAFVKVLASNTWESGGDTDVYSRDTFYVSLVPPQVARAEMATHPLGGG